MKTYKITLFCLALSVALSGCGKPDNPDPGTNPGTNPGTDPGTDPATPFFTASLPDEWVFNMDPGAMSWPVETNITDWTATSSESWCKPTPMTDQLWLDIEDYDARDENGYERFDPPRTCTVTVKAGSVYSKTIQIVQQTHTIIYFPQKDYSREYDWIEDGPTGMTVFLSADGQTRDLLVTTNTWRWIPETDAAWLKVECVNNSTLRLTSTARAETVTAARSAQVKVYDKYNEYFVYSTFTVEDAPATVGGEDFGYGDHTEWD